MSSTASSSPTSTIPALQRSLPDTLGDLEITDPHHHLWDLSANYYPWLTDRITPRVCGEYGAIRRNYLLEDFRRDTAPLNVVRTIHVQAEHDRGDPVRETRWLQQVADRLESDGVPHGIVAYADLSRDDAAAVLDAHAQSPNLRGIRQMLHESLIDTQHPSSPSSTPLEHPTWWRNIGLLRKRGLSFDLQVYPQQMARALDLLRAYPDVQFVLCHTGQPVRRDPEGLEDWRRGMRLLAQAPNLAVKISGLGMFDRAWTVESLRPILLETIDTFGAGRCCFASNFPVDGMMATYADLWRAYGAITAAFSPGERAGLFSANARRVYRV